MSTPGVRVVLVEDDRRVARVNRDLLEADPDVLVVGIAGNVDEGDRLVTQLRPDLVLLDVFLPDGTGLDLLRAWRARGEVVEVVMVTAADDAHTVGDALAHGVLDYLLKPFDRARLAETLRRFRARKRLAHDTFDQARLDRLLGVGGAGEPALPKGVDPHTLERVSELLARQEAALSAEEVGGRVGLSRVSAWRYLEHLVAQGRAEVHLQYGAGRPTKLYRAVGGG